MQWGVRYVKLDRREYKRVPTKIPVTFLWRDRQVDGIVTDLSVAGCTLETDTGIPYGDVLQLQFQATGESAAVSVEIVMVRSTRSRQVGLKFIEMRQDEKDRLVQMMQDFLHRLP